MQRRMLCREGPEVPVLGLGAWAVGEESGGVTEAQALDTVRAGIDAGFTVVDTAEAYRPSEERLGRALKNGYRERCFLATKVSFDYSAQGIQNAVEESLRALQTDVIDLYQIHTWREEYPIGETMRALQRAQEAGKVRYIGVSNLTADQMSQARKIVPFHTNQVAYNLFNRAIEERAVGFCRKHGIGILAHSPLDKGLLTGKYGSDHAFPPEDERSTFPRFQGKPFKRYLGKADQLAEIAAGKGISLAQLALAWTLRLPEVACSLVGAKSPDQIQEQAHAAEVRFSQDELSAIERTLEE
jgi:aryl-alcohol dehydrogenase-like predicted oxidoreductase